MESSWARTKSCHRCQILRHWRGHIDSTRTWLKYRKCIAIRSKLSPEKGLPGRGQRRSANNVILMLFAVWWEFNYEKPSICFSRSGFWIPDGKKWCDRVRQMRRAIPRNVLSAEHLSSGKKSPGCYCFCYCHCPEEKVKWKWNSVPIPSPSPCHSPCASLIPGRLGLSSCQRNKPINSVSDELLH